MAKQRGKKSRKVLFVIEIIILLLFIGGLFVYGQINTKLNKINTPAPENFDREQVEMNVSAPELKGYTNIALFALDHRAKTESAGGENSDTIIIASIDNDSKDVKLVSVYRDTLLDVGNDTYQKCNAAYAYGGPQQALSMLNTNLDMNIQDYVTVDFKAMVTAIDMLGGIEVPLSYQEMVHLNNYCVETSEETDTDYTPLELPDPKPEDETETMGVYHLDGVQATSYCRIRYTAGLDFERTERQRRVIQLMVAKAKKSSIATLSSIMDEVFPYVETSFDKSEILKMAVSMLSYSIDDTTGFPKEMKMATLESKGSVVIPDTLETNVKLLHEFLFPKETYTPSATVKGRSQTIANLSGDEASLNDLQKALDDDNSAGIQITPEPTYQDYNNTTPTDTTTWQPPTETQTPGTGWTDPGYTDPGTGWTDPGYTDPGNGWTDPGTSTDPVTPVDPGWTDPSTSTDPGTGWTDPGYTDPGTGWTDPGYTDPGYTDPGTGGYTESGAEVIDTTY